MAENEKLHVAHSLHQQVWSTGIQKNTHRCPDVNDERLQTMIPAALPELLSAYTKAVRKAHPTTSEEVLAFSAQYFQGMVEGRL